MRGVPLTTNETFTGRNSELGMIKRYADVLSSTPFRRPTESSGVFRQRQMFDQLRKGLLESYKHRLEERTGCVGCGATAFLLRSMSSSSTTRMPAAPTWFVPMSRSRHAVHPPEQPHRSRANRHTERAHRPDA